MTNPFRPNASDEALPAAVTHVIEAIETDIIFGRILPRTRLIEDHLMEDYDAKRHVVRSALTELQRLGVVVKPPHRGAEIRRFDPDSLAALYRMREVLHRAAVAMVVFPIDPARIEALRRAAAEHAAATRSGDPITIHRSNMRFHRLFYGLCDNPYLSESIRLHDWLSFPARAYGIASAEAQQQAREEHATMAEAAASGDRAVLDHLCVHHMQNARAIYVERFFARSRVV